MQNGKRLVRSQDDKFVAGVASGLAEYFSIDVSIVRLIFVLLAVFGGSGLIIYVVLWIIVPSDSSQATTSENIVKENVEELKNRTKDAAEFVRSPDVKRNKSKIIGYLLLAFGILLIMDFLGVFQFAVFWPILIIFFGLILLRR